jgi:hypothetical protein
VRKVKTFSVEAYRNEIGRYEKQEPSKKSGKTFLATYFDGVLDHLIKLVEEEPILWDKRHPKWLENNKKIRRGKLSTTSYTKYQKGLFDNNLLKFIILKFLIFHGFKKPIQLQKEYGGDKYIKF